MQFSGPDKSRSRTSAPAERELRHTAPHGMASGVDVNGRNAVLEALSGEPTTCPPAGGCASEEGFVFVFWCADSSWPFPDWSEPEPDKFYPLSTPSPLLRTLHNFLATATALDATEHSCLAATPHIQSLAFKASWMSPKRLSTAAAIVAPPPSPPMLIQPCPSTFAMRATHAHAQNIVRTNVMRAENQSFRAVQNREADAMDCMML